MLYATLLGQFLCAQSTFTTFIHPHTVQTYFCCLPHHRLRSQTSPKAQARWCVTERPEPIWNIFFCSRSCQVHRLSKLN
jgi:hypothetical protein